MTHLKEIGEKRTDMDCHACSKTFVALIDYDINGNHVINCPHCGHEHCRVINDGEITNERWEGRNDVPPAARPRRIWKNANNTAETLSASHFLRSKWLNRSDVH